MDKFGQTYNKSETYEENVAYMSARVKMLGKTLGAGVKCMGRTHFQQEKV